VMLRQLYANRMDLVENTEIINQFTNDVLSVVRPFTDLETAKKVHLVFEAIIENEIIKIDVLKKLNQLCATDTYFFTNTSSIPISVLDKGVGLNGRIIGFHFYNPPAVQKLAELITTDSTQPEVINLSKELARRLRKKVIPANDIAGFIGNGHFMRDILHAIHEATRLTSEFSLSQAIYIMNRISQDFLIRPMGIFQLVDYVGVDVCQCILKVMNHYIPGKGLHSELIDRMVEKKLLGGQYADGSQKDGFLKYQKNRPIGIFVPESGEYHPFDASGWVAAIDEKIGPLPEGHLPWRVLLADPKRGQKLQTYFINLRKMDTMGAKLASAYLKRSKEIGEGLVKDGVASSENDVNGVLLNGFYHLYGPINDYI